MIDLEFSLTGKVAVVTGGASGIGAAVSSVFSRKGAHVVVVDIDLAAAQRQVEDLVPAGAAYRIDVADHQAVVAGVRQIVDDHQRIDVLVNCAGIAPTAPVEELDIELWNKTIDVNLRGTFSMSQVVGRTMLAQGSGSIINISSQASHVAVDGHTAYGASKAGVKALARNFALEWGNRGIRVNSISPTVVDTPLGQENWSGPEADAFRARILTGRFAEADEIAVAALYLASENSRMINGTEILLDGGFTAH